MNTRRFIKTLAAGVALAAALAAPAFALDKVVYGTASRVGLVNSAMYAAQELGFFKDEGIELETVQFEGTGVLLPQMANKSIMIGYPIPDFLIASHDTGKDPLPLKFFYNVTRVYNWEIVVLEDSPIKTLADLKGKKIGVVTLSTGNVPVTRSMLREAGLNPSTDIELVSVGQGPAAVNAFKTGQIDALNQFDVVHSQIAASGIKIRRIKLPEKYMVLSGNSFATHVDTIKEKPDLLKRFGRAYSKAMVVCEINPEGCIRSAWRLHPTIKPKDGDDPKVMASEVSIMMDNLRNKIPSGEPKARKYGEFIPESFRTNIAILAENGMLKKTDIPLDLLFTNDFVPDFGKFDYDKLVAFAKTMK